MISVDSETTGLDLYHTARPFLVTTCDEEGSIAFWEWDVDPYTRQPRIPQEDLDEVQNYIGEQEQIVLHNTKFDVTALNTILPGLVSRWDWKETYDTVIAGHLLASNQPHDLTSMALVYLRRNIKPLEDAVQKVVDEARRFAKKNFPDWQLAEKGNPDMPSVKGQLWKNDMWLPRAIAKTKRYPQSHPWWTVTSNYANMDSSVTIALAQRVHSLLKERDLWGIYLERLKGLRVGHLIEKRGVTCYEPQLQKMQSAYQVQAAERAEVCLKIAKTYNYDLELPKSGCNGSLNKFVFEVMKFKQVAWSDKTGLPSMDKDVLDKWLHMYEEDTPHYKFVKNMLEKRKRDTSLSFMESYVKFWQPWSTRLSNGWYVLHPNLNYTGTDTLRWSCSNPNSQQISKLGMFEGDKETIRTIFGPAPGREWFSFDAKNIELRVLAYDSLEEAMILLFERPNDPPYFGSNHLLVGHILHPKLFEDCLSCARCSKEIWVPASIEKREKCCSCSSKSGIVDGRIFKKRYAATWYQWVKNGNFAVTYGAMVESGTADRAYHVPGGQAIIENRFTKIKELNQRCIAFAQKHGYIETIPDKSVNPRRGYPLLCSRTNYGQIKPTVPLNYRTQGTAMWWTTKAMVKVQEQLDIWNGDKPNYFMVLQVHDELVLDFPKGRGPEPWKTNLPKVRKIQSLMASCGDDIGIPTPVGVEYHDKSWGEGLTL